MSTVDTALVTAPASFAQRRLWFLDRFEPGTAVYNIPLAVWLSGKLDRAAVQRALEAIAARHETLRTTFLAEEGEVMQAIHALIPLPWRIEPVADEPALAAAMAVEARRSFDLVAGPLWRAVLFACAEEDHVLLLTLHHIVSDGWSLGVLVREFSQLYSAFAAGSDAALPELEIQYADFAAWQREQGAGEPAQRQIAFWRRVLAGAPTAPLLLTDRPRPAVMTTAGRTHRFELAPALTRELHELARHAGASLFAVLLSGFAVLLRRWSGSEDLVIGTPVANRTRREIEPLIGFFVNTLPLRIDAAGEPTGWALVERVSALTLEALAHQDVPFEQLVQELQPDRALGHTPLFQVLFVLQNAPVGALRLPGLAAAPVEVDTGTAKFDLTLALEESGGRLIGRLEYNCDLFEDATAARIAAQYEFLLSELVRAPGASIDALRLQDAKADAGLLQRWNATARPYPERSLAGLFAEQAARTPDATAVRFGGARLSYAELDARANRLAHVLRARGVGPDQPVALCLERSLELVVALVAIVKAGGAYVGLDPEYPAARLALMLADAGVRVLVTQEALADQLTSAIAASGATTISPVILERAAAELAAAPGTDPGVRVTPDHLAYISYTSGSTGRPKGVAIPQRGVVRLVKNTDFAEFGPKEVFLQLAPVAFDASTLELWAPLLNGGTLVVMAPGTPTLEALGATIRTERITTLWLTAGLFHLMVDERLDDLRGVRQLLAGGDVLSVAHVRKFLREVPACRLINGYGPTENTTFTCCATLRESDLAGGSVPIGRPIANTRVYVLDAALRPVPIGMPGELFAGGDGLARGYVGRNELMAEKFVADPFSSDPRARLYRTGDRVRWRNDGTLEFLGRQDQQVKIRGYRVEPAEAEAALTAEPGVRAAVVVVREHAGHKRLIGYAVADGTSGDTLRTRLQARLPEYLVPAVVVTLEALPLTPNGKVDRAALPEPDTSAVQTTDAPRTPAEEVMTLLWARVLGVERVGVEDNFFAIGGHSLLATQLVTRIREAFGVELPLRAVFEAPTVRALAQRMTAGGQAGGAVPPALRCVERGRDLPLSFAQERLWFLNQLEPGNPFYNMPAALRLQGRFDVPAAAGVLQELTRRHESLRTTFAAVEGQPVQVIAASAQVPLPVIDLAALPAAERADAARRWTAEEARRPFDLARGPLLRAALLRLADDEHILLLTMHHIVSDGWSMGVLTRELGELYAAATEGRASPLPELSIQYVDFAVWQRGWLRGAVLATQLDYWKQQLAGAPPVLKLPTDRPRPAVQSFRGGSHAFRLDGEITAQLQALSRRAGTTLFMTLEAAFAVLLSRYSDQPDIVVGTPIANRHRAEIEPLIGFFVNTLVLRNDLTGEPSFLELLGRVRRAALDAYAHQDLPFERLVDELQPERDLSRNPIFQVMFALHNTPHRERVLPGLTITDLAAERISAQFDLVLDVWETSDGLKAVLEYATDLFDPGTIERMAGHWRTLLAAAVAAPETSVAQLPLLTAAERSQLLDAFNAAQIDYPDDRTIQQLFAAQVAATPERVAVVHRERRLTYAELDALANRIAVRLRCAGVQRGDFVAILDERGVEFLAAMLAILKAGAAFIPIDPGYPEERVRHMVHDSAVPVLITRRSVWQRHGAERLRPASLREVLLLDEVDNACAESSGATAAPVAGAPGDAAYMLYTSGSTGAPKGAIVRHNGAINHIFGQFRELEFTPGTAFLQSAPSSSDISVWQFLAPLLIGGRTVIADFETVCDAAQLFRLVRDEGITLIELVPVVLKEFLDHAATLPAPRRALPALAYAMVTGEAVSVALVNQWFQLYPAIRLANAYGPTEAADDICQAMLSGPLPVDAPTVPIGRPLPNLTLYVLDRHRQLVPVGVPGEIAVSGVGVGAGYWRNEEKTRAAFVTNPYDDAGRRGAVIYRTGDLGRWRPDGTLEMLGRFDQQVKLRGFRIELGEIESMLARHPAVGEAVVLIREDQPGEKRLAAYATLNASAEELQAKASGLAAEQVQLWQDLHEDSYAETRALADEPTANVIGWDSNYTGQPLSDAEMREYITHTVERVRALRPRRVLEIGCGTGLLLAPLAPHVEHYLAADLSRVAITRLQQQLAGRPEFAHVELRAQRADDFSAIAPASVDVVMLCSVVQYFPGVDYLLKVIEGALRVLRPGGAIFFGDVRVRALLPAFHASVQLFKAPDTLTAAGLRRRVRAALQREQEMALAPEFFVALRHRYPQISRLEVRPKRGRIQNEMTRFRCDVTVHVGGSGEPTPQFAWENWPRQPISCEDLRRRLATGEEAVALRNVANPRVQRERYTLSWLDTARADERVADFRAALAAAPAAGIDPDELSALGEELGYAVDTALAMDGDDGRYDVVFRKLDPDGRPLPALDLTPVDRAVKPWASYANNPLHEKLARGLVPQLRTFLRERLPSYMVPADFVVLDALPQLPNGKVDRRALPAPETAELAEADHVAPRNATEAQLAAIWGAVLGLGRVSVTANFFELGGHSLKATQVVSRICREFGCEVALRELFNQPTIAEFAATLETARRARHEPIPRVADAADYPLSHAQLRLWVLAQLEGALTAYNMPAAVLLEGAVDRAALEQAFAQLVQRHESLRTTFVLIDGAPRQRVHPAPLGELEFADVSGGREPEAQARELALAHARRPFDLERGPLVRIALVRIAPDRHALLFNMHHIVSDDWSTGVLVNEFIRRHDALVAGEEPALAPLRVHYRDYAGWQNARLAADGMAEHRAYWREKFAGTLPVLQLPTDRPRPAVKSYVGRTRSFALSPELTRALHDLAQREQATLFMALTAAVDVLLHRYSGQRDLIVGSPIAGRTHPDLEDQIGFYINTLPLRATIDPAAAFTTLLAQVRQTATEAYEHQAYPFDRLVDDLALERDVTRTPLFDVVVVMQNVDPYALALNGVSVRPFVDDFGGSKFDLQFNFEEREATLRGSVVFNTDLFEEERIARMIAHLTTLLESIAADPGCAVGRLELLGGAERRQVVEEFQGAAGEWASGRTLVSWFEAQVAQTPDAIAVSREGVALSYAELNARANRLAWRLRRAGVEPEARVGMYFERTVELVVGIVAILKAGGAYVPFDPVYPAERIGFMLRDAAPRVLLTQQKHEAFCRGLVADGTELVCADDPSLVGERTENLGLEVRPEQAAYVIYTSGSTGQPKGCVVEHRQVVRLFEATQAWYRFGREDVWTLFHSYAFDFSVWELWGALLYGGRLVVVPFETSRSPEAFLELLRQEKVTVLNQTPSAFRGLMAADESARPAPLSLRYVIFGGEALEPASLAPWWERHGDEQPQLVNMYGITETTVHVTYRPLRRADGANGSVIGRPIPDLRLYVLDAFQQPVPIGVVGEIYVGGAGVARGYLNRPELTAERFVPDRLDGRPGATLYRSGDLARWRADGELEYLGRADHQVKIRGFRIELGEIEAALASHPAVRSALVLLREERGGDRRLAGYVVLRETNATNVTELREHVRTRVPEYMVPAGLAILEKFPLTPNGKIDRAALPAPETTPGAANAGAPVQDELEATIARIWREALGVGQVGRDDSFFDIGGHSLLVVQVHKQLRETLGVELSVIDLFKHATIRALAAHLRASRTSEPDAAATTGIDAARERARQQKAARQRRRPGGGTS
ncbi:non-ribosomal peptide synthetase [Opitutus terrae]|uniref:Amino acid adenylation domain protein n=1 Tax=Opitutus terrae (strain DSM 11246 / JCM 15787 / PB90-1) TaxID=452637 RepID=B1ZYL5_OPITP|nr:non-ribosomal peptide synthetase [Opitutus terrae]ACB75251.1 amino acid adenylation domain protein [Opitutus terrae PB90-1]